MYFIYFFFCVILDQLFGFKNFFSSKKEIKNERKYFKKLAFSSIIPSVS